MHTNGQIAFYGAPFVKILYLTDLAQKMVYMLNARRDNYICAEIAKCAQR